MSIFRSKVGSHELVRLACGRGVSMTIAPSAGLCVVSLVAGGVELLALPAPLAEFLAAERTGGIPLLYPWANRLRGDGPVVLGRALATRGARLCHRDGNGLPLHGLLLRWPHWWIDECRADEESARFAASLDWARHEELMGVFPFPHRMSVRFDLAPSRLEITTRVEAREVDVPVSFGWHPYLALGALASARAVRLPARRAVPLDAQRLPIIGMDDASLGAMPAPTPLVAADDLFTGITDGATVEVVDGASIRRIEFVRGYDHMQLFAQPGAAFVCVEPMTAAIAGLSDGVFPRVAKGGTFEAVWRLWL